ncbi:MAG: hypothetical protein AAF481_08760 [Acidobacteriota bacterium]
MNPASWTDEELREMLSVDGETDRPQSDCPDSDLIWQAVAQELSPEDTRKVLAHVSQCPFCARAWGLASDMESLPRPSERRTAAFIGYLPKIAAAAVVLVVIGVGALFFLPKDVERGAQAELTTSMTADTVLSASEFELRWQHLDADRFDLRVTWITSDHSGEVIEIENLTASPSGETTFRVPEQDLEGVPSGARILWRVTAKSGALVLDEQTFTARFGSTASPP